MPILTKERLEELDPKGLTERGKANISQAVIVIRRKT